MGTLFNFDWVPTLNLGKKQSKTPKESDAEAAKARDERVKERRKHELERQEIEAAKKRKELNQSGLPILDIASTVAHLAYIPILTSLLVVQAVMVTKKVTRSFR